MLIGAYGMFWDRDAVSWGPFESRSWSMLGQHGSRKPKLRVVDFRRARGVYVLFDHFGPTYVGLARGEGGIGGRFLNHYDDPKKKWERFCWFSFDGVKKQPLATGLYGIDKRDKPVPHSDTDLIGDLEALLITILGTRAQNKMRFQGADEWKQVDYIYEEKMRAQVTPGVG